MLLQLWSKVKHNSISGIFRGAKETFCPPENGFKPGVRWPQAGVPGFLELFLCRRQYVCVCLCVCPPPRL